MKTLREALWTAYNDLDDKGFGEALARVQALENGQRDPEELNNDASFIRMSPRQSGGEMVGDILGAYVFYRDAVREIRRRDLEIERLKDLIRGVAHNLKRAVS